MNLDAIQYNAASDTQCDTSGWHAAHVQACHELSVSDELKLAGNYTLLPLFSKVSGYSDRKKLVHLPRYPENLFYKKADTLISREVTLISKGVVTMMSGTVPSEAERVPEGRVMTFKKVMNALIKPDSQVSAESQDQMLSMVRVKGILTQ